MLYILLIIIIMLLLKIMYSTRDKGAEAQAYWNKLFKHPVVLPEYKKDDPRNKTHPGELVKYKSGSVGMRSLGMLFDAENKDHEERGK